MFFLLLLFFCIFVFFFFSSRRRHTRSYGDWSSDVCSSDLGAYVVWCKVLSPDSGQDSFFVSVDGGTEFIYSTVINGGYSSAWQWTFVNADAVNPSVFSFSAGQHSIQFRSREAYTGLDQLLITNDPSYVPGANTPPTISSIADLSISQNTATAPIAFTVGDAQTSAGSLVVSGASSSPALVPNANIVFGGSGANRTVTVTPALNQTGTATITVTVSDGSLTASDSFVLTVNATANTTPTISTIADLSTTQDTATAQIATTVAESQTTVASLIISCSSCNPSLVPVGNTLFAYTTLFRSVTVTPALNQTGTATITVTVSDGSLTASKSFVLTVNPAGAFTPVYLALEAESATLVSPMAISSDANASGGKYISPTADSSGTATFTINIPVAGTYVVWCRALSPDNSRDSFFVSVDGGTEIDYSTVINGGYTNSWQWTFVNADMVNPSVF